MNIEQLRLELELDEGCKYVTYKCSEDRLTFGIGHLVLPDDPEYDQPVGTAVSSDRVTECFDKDVGTVIAESKKLYPQFDSLPEEVKLIICNMLFNLGLPTLSKFKDMKAAIDAEQWSAAADAMLDSKWARQLPNRSGRLITRMRNVFV
jgi:lysozyme